MSRSTFDLARLKKKALRQAEAEEEGSVIEWLRSYLANKYKLPPNDPRLAKRTPGSVYLEVLEDYHKRRDEIAEAIRTNNGDLTKLSEALTAIDKFLGTIAMDAPLVTGDETFDEWERAIAEGRPLPESLTKGIVKPKPAIDTMNALMQNKPRR